MNALFPPPLFALLFFCVFTWGQAVAQSKTDVPQHAYFKEVVNLQALGELSHKKQLPILLMFGAKSCEYCNLLIQEVLEPMALSGLYDGKVMLMRHVGVDEPSPIPSWTGALLKKSQWAYALDADLTPTVLFVNGRGEEVAPRIIGVPEIILYSGLIHQHLNMAYQNMGLEKHIPATPELLYLQTNNNSRTK
ncbi:hypothetical protein MNBD_GAMMA04-252 [hydrothermal vent metagenome]|uniref:Thioredoxin-like fold domain-containing protein n=1 Tax=hydrothermal vent metagenome TaxID=652676 RepID=A0A3B0W9Q1_9ZZZZ